jgi:ribonuclease P protein component, eubacterial
MTEPDNIPLKQRFTLSKKERLCSEKEIETLFSSGERFLSFPLQVVYARTEKKGVEASVLFSVSKKRFKRAVHRNRIKRLMRECFRLNKQPLYELLEGREAGLNIAIIFIDKELPAFELVEKGMIKAIAKLIQQLQ